jgi:hypothetical protein
MPNQTLQNILDFFGSIRPGQPYSSTVIIQFVNEVDGSIWNELYRYKTSADILRVNGQAAYSLPAGFDFNDVINTFVDGVEIPRIDASMYQTTGYYRDSTGKLVIYPVPTASDSSAGLHVVHNVPYTKHTALTDTSLVPAPFDRMYYEYLTAKYDFLRKDFNSYNNEVDAFSGTWGEHVTWWTAKNPFTKEESGCNLLKPNTQQTLLKRVRT